MKPLSLSTLELCAGAGGQALGLEQAGIALAGLVEIDRYSCATLRQNRPNWNVLEQDLTALTDVSAFKGVDIVSGGPPGPPLSKTGKQLGQKDEQNLFLKAIDVVDQLRPRAVMIESARGLLDAVFGDYRIYMAGKLQKLGYVTDWRLLNASDFGVPQLRPRIIFVAIQSDYASTFSWPEHVFASPGSVGEALYDLMAVRGWRGAKEWKKRANEIAPAVVGSSKKHGDPDLGPAREKLAWAELGVNGHLLAEEAPARDFVGMPSLTVPMVSRLQGFPDSWKFAGGKADAFCQVVNALPPPVACAVARRLVTCLLSRSFATVMAG